MMPLPSPASPSPCTWSSTTLGVTSFATPSTPELEEWVTVGALTSEDRAAAAGLPGSPKTRFAVTAIPAPAAPDSTATSEMVARPRRAVCGARVKGLTGSSVVRCGPVERDQVSCSVMLQTLYLGLETALRQP